MRANTFAIGSLALLSLAGVSDRSASQSWSAGINLPSVSACPQPGDRANEALADSLVHSIYATLEKEGLITGPGVIPDSPLMVRGKPAIALFVLQQHDKEGTQYTDSLLAKTQKLFGARVLFEEGESFCPETQAEAKVQIDEWIADLVARCASKSELENALIDVTINPIYAPRPAAVQFPQRFGWESSDLQDYFDHVMILCWYLGLESIGLDIDRTGRSPLLLDGKFVKDDVAKMADAAVYLEQRFPDSFPKLLLTQRLATVEDALDHKPHEISFASDKESYLEYRQRADEFFTKHELYLRNVFLSSSLSRYFSDSNAEPLAVIVVGRDHILDAEGLSAAQILSNWGIASASVLAINPERNQKE